jgi:hypothetical protein
MEDKQKIEESDRDLILIFCNSVLIKDTLYNRIIQKK